MRYLPCFFSLCGPLVVSIDAQQLDPIKNMCLRFDHQATLKNHTLYIDGGRESFVDLDPSTGQRLNSGNVTVTEGYNNYLIMIDLTVSWNASNVTQTAIPKVPAPNAGSFVPVLSRGALFAGRPDDRNLYLFGGTTSPWNESFPGYVPPLPPQNALWAFDPVAQKWDTYNTGQTIQNRPNGGPWVEAPRLGLGFFFNGMLDDHSEAGDNYNLANDSKPFLEGMIVVDTNTRTARNLSTVTATGSWPVSRGKMAYVKMVGSKGILVVIGGNHKDVTDYSNSFVGELIPMDQINVFDVGSYYNASTPDGVWYKQMATGDIPPRRLDHCLMVASAPDNSSHNIYMFGGRGSNGSQNIFYGDAYILSIPSFVWTKIYDGLSPIYGHQCTRATNRQMILSGGAMDFNYGVLPCDPRASGISVFDISETAWVDGFDASFADKEYLLPTQIVSQIGGNRTGGATKLRPATGFDQGGLAQLFNEQQLEQSTTRPEAQITRHSIPRIPFILASVFGSATILGVGVAFSYFYRRRLRKLLAKVGSRAEMDGESKPDKPEIDGTPARLELPSAGTTATPIRYVEPCAGLVELSVNEKDLPWRELPPRESDLPWEELDSKTRWDSEPLPPWEPPVTKHGVPF